MLLFLHIRDTEERESFKYFTLFIVQNFHWYRYIFATIIPYRSIAPVLKTKYRNVLYDKVARTYFFLRVVFAALSPSDVYGINMSWRRNDKDYCF